MNLRRSLFSIACMLFVAALLAVTILDALNNTRLTGLEVSGFSLIPAIALFAAGVYRREHFAYLILAALLILAEYAVLNFLDGIAKSGAATFRLM